MCAILSIAFATTAIIAVALAILLYQTHANRSGETEESKKTTLEEADSEKRLFGYLREKLGEEFLNALSTDEGLAFLGEFVERKRQFINAHRYLKPYEDEYLDHLQELHNSLSSTEV